ERWVYYLVREPRAAPRLARLSLDDDGRTARTRAGRRAGADHLHRVRARARLVLRCALRRRRYRAGQTHTRGDHRHGAAVMVAVDVAGDGIGDARVLRALRPSPDPVVSHGGTKDLRGAHRRDGAFGDPDGGAHRRAD